jgi:hypothetical protein
MRMPRVLPVLAVTAVVLVVSAAGGGGTRPADGAAHDRLGAGVAASAPAEKLPPMVLLFATSDLERLKTLRVEVCTVGDTVVPGRTTYKVDVRTPEEPVDAACLNVAVPDPLNRADMPARTGVDRDPATFEDQYDGGIGVVNDLNISALGVQLCNEAGVMFVAVPTGFVDSSKLCKGIPLPEGT